MRAGACVAVLLVSLALLSACADSGGGESIDRAFFYPTRVAVTPDPYDPDGVYLFAINYIAGTMSVVDVFDNDDDILIRNRSKNHEDSTAVDVGEFPVDLAVSPGGDRVFVCGAQGTDLYVMDVPAFTTRTIDVQAGPCHLAVAGNTLIVADRGEPRLIAVDLDTETAVAETDLDAEPMGVAVSEGQKTVFVTTASADVRAITVADLTVSAGPVFLDGEPTRLAVSPGGAELYVINRQPGLVHRLDAVDLSRTAKPIEVPGIPRDLLFVPDGHWMYLTNDDGQVYVLDKPLGRFCVSRATEPEFDDVGAISNPTMDAIDVVDCLVHEEEWEVTYDLFSREWVVKGEKSGKQTNRAKLDRAYVSDDGAFSFTIRSGSRAPSEGDQFTFETDPGIGPIRVGVLPDGMTVVPDYDDPEFYIVWIANTLSDNLNHVTTDDHENLGSVN